MSRDNYDSYQKIRTVFSVLVVWEIDLNETRSKLDLNDKAMTAKKRQKAAAELKLEATKMGKTDFKETMIKN